MSKGNSQTNPPSHLQNKRIKETEGKLHNQPMGLDLPASETELFQLHQHPLLTTEEEIDELGDITTLKELLILMTNEAIPEDGQAIQEAYTQKNWNKIEALAHKIKSGALYCGTKRLKYACQYLERYCQTGHTELLDPLYQQVNHTLFQTQQAINEWLEITG